MSKWCKFSGRGIRYSTAAAAADDNNDHRGGTAPLTPSSAATSWETMTTTTAMTTTMTMTTTKIALHATIKLTVVAVLVPYLACRGLTVIDFTELVLRHLQIC